jgi:hypothetical protein
MFTDPLSVTYNGSAKSLYAGTGQLRGAERVLFSRYYNTSDGEFLVRTRASRGNQIEKNEILLARILHSTDPDPLNRPLPFNAVSVSVLYDSNRSATSVDVPRLRAALFALVDDTFMGRMVGGEI